MGGTAETTLVRLSLREESAITAASASPLPYPESFEAVPAFPRGPGYRAGLRSVAPIPRQGAVVGGAGRFVPERPEPESVAELPGVAHRLRRAGLTARDLLVLGYLAEGWTTAEIARQLVYAESTIKKEVHMIVHRMGARNRTHAVAMAVRGSMI